MKDHIRIFALISIVFGILGLLAAAIVFVAVAGGGLISGDPTAITVTSIVAVAVSGIISIFAFPQIIAGWGILKFKSWSRILGIIIAILNLVNIPIGTAYGIYGLWVLMNEETEKIFKEQQESTVVVE
jgi:hypothetical protein